MAMAMNDAVKRKEPEPETEAMADLAKQEETKVVSTEAPKIAVAIKTTESSEPDAKRLKLTPDAAAIRKQVEYYLSDDNLKHDKFFHGKISGNSEGWLELALILSCNKMKATGVTRDEVLAALKDSKVEVRQDAAAIRRPGNLGLPSLEARPQHPKKGAAHAHDGGVIACIKNIPAEQSWTQIKDCLRAKLPDKVQLWFVSQVTEKRESVVAVAPFDEDLKFFDELVLEVAGVKLSCQVAHGEDLQAALKLLPKHLKDKREKEVRKKQKGKNRPIVVGAQRFINVPALRTRVKEILNSRSDGEQLKTDGSDYKLIRALLAFHPKGESKSRGVVGLKVAKSSQGDSRCFWMVKEDASEEDFSAQKCLSALEANPPYVELDAKDSKKGKENVVDVAPAKAEDQKIEKKETNANVMAEGKDDDASQQTASDAPSVKADAKDADANHKEESDASRATALDAAPLKADDQKIEAMETDAKCMEEDDASLANTSDVPVKPGDANIEAMEIDSKGVEESNHGDASQASALDVPSVKADDPKIEAMESDVKDTEQTGASQASASDAPLVQAVEQKIEAATVETTEATGEKKRGGGCSVQ